MPKTSGLYPEFDAATLDSNDTVMYRYVDSVTVDSRIPRVVRLPSGEAVTLPERADLDTAVGKYVVYEIESGSVGGPVQTDPEVTILDTTTGNAVQAPKYPESSVTVWGDYVKRGNCFVANMATAEVLMNRCDQEGLPQNALAGKYLYVDDGVTDPVIDTETMRTVSERWSVLPLTRIPGWTVVSESGPDQRTDQEVKLVRDRNGEYPGPWW